MNNNHGKKKRNGCDDVSAEEHNAKKTFKATDAKNAPKSQIYASLFTSSTKPEDQRKETFLARSTRLVNNMVLNIGKICVCVCVCVVLVYSITKKFTLFLSLSLYLAKDD